MNTYGYAAGDPVNGVDPEGLGWITKTWKFIKNKGDVAATFADTAQSAADVVNPALSPASRTIAAVEVASELAPVSLGDLKGLYKWTKGKLATKSVGNFSRNISPSDLGVKGNLKELKGSFGVNDGVATARIDMIRGEIKNPLEIVSNLANTARSSGASSLKIEGTLANERLYNILSKRYGLTSQGAKDVITIPLQ
jgi:hypothetical protein